MQLNVDGTIIASPGGFVAADIPVVFQFDKNGALIQPAKIWSNEELDPQNAAGLGTFYLVTFYDQNGATLNNTPLWWIFPEVLGATVDISQMVAISTVGGNILYYPRSIGGTGTVTSVAFVGDGVVDSATPSTPVTTTGTITATILSQSASTFLAGPTTGAATAPTFRTIQAVDLPALVNVWSSLTAATADLTLANTTFNTNFNQTTAANWTWANITAATNSVNQSSPSLIFKGTYWDGAASQMDSFVIQNIVTAGSNPGTSLDFSHTGSSAGGSYGFHGAVNITSTLAVGNITQGAAGTITQTQAHGETNVYGSSTELITLSTSGTTTDSAANLLPAGAIIDAVVARVTTTISGGSTPTTWEIGDPTTAARFTSTGSALTSGTTVVGLNQMQGVVTTTAAGPTQAAAAKVRITLDQTPGQGVVRITVFWRQFTAPTS